MLVADPDDKYSVDWQIGVLPDGSSRIGYAQYVCGRLAELKLVDDHTDVRIVDLLALEANGGDRSEEHTSELQSLMRISYAVFCLKKNTKDEIRNTKET